jgi:hypothetical protein
MCRRRRSCHDPSPRSGRSEFPLLPVDESSAGRQLHRPSVAASSRKYVRGFADQRRLWVHRAAECSGSCSTLQAMLSRRCIPPERVLVSDRVRSFNAAHSSTSRCDASELAFDYLRVAQRLPDSAELSGRDRPRDSEARGPVEFRRCPDHHRPHIKRVTSDPESGFSRPLMQRIMVVLPAPLGPKNPSSSPGRSSSEIPFNASRPR